MKRAVLIVLLAIISSAQNAFSHSVPVYGDILLLMTCLTVFRDDNGRLPTAGEGLQALVTNPDPANLPNWRQLWTTLPSDPWGRPYQYLPPTADRQQPGIYSFGPDRISQSNGNDPDDRNSWNGETTSGRPRSGAVGRVVAACCGIGTILFGLYYATRRRNNLTNVA